MNKVLLIGRLGKDPELKYTPAGAAVANFSLATSERWKDKEGNKQEKTEWHNIVAWNKQAEVMGEYLRKGSLVFIEGKNQTRSWDDTEGKKHYKTEVKVWSFEFLDSKKEIAPDKPFKDEPPASEPEDDSLPF